MKLRLYAFADLVQRGGDFVNRHFFDVTQQDDFAVMIGQGLNRVIARLAIC